MFRHELMMGDVDQQFPLRERLNHLGQYNGRELHGGGCDGVLGYKDACLECLLPDQLDELAHVLDAERRCAVELDPHGASSGDRVRVAGGGERGVFLKHGSGGLELDLHLLAAGGVHGQ